MATKNDQLDLIAQANKALEDIESTYNTTLEKANKVRAVFTRQTQEFQAEFAELGKDLGKDINLIQTAAKRVQDDIDLLQRASAKDPHLAQMLPTVVEMYKTYNDNLNTMLSLSSLIHMARNGNFMIYGLIKGGRFKSAKNLRGFSEWSGDDATFGHLNNPTPDILKVTARLENASRLLERILKSIKPFVNSELLGAIEVYKGNINDALGNSKAHLAEFKTLQDRIVKGQAFVNAIDKTQLATSQGKEVQKKLYDLTDKISQQNHVFGNDVYKLESSLRSFG